MSSGHNFFRKMAIISSIISTSCVVFIVISVPIIYMKTSTDWKVINEKTDQFKENTTKIWAYLQNLQKRNAYEVPKFAVFFSRKPRALWSQQICSGCNQLNCPVGSPGLPGLSGDDGLPGGSGLPGKSGDDGYDVKLEPENDLPWVICPAGPPGLRGMQGERGEPGNPGQPGQLGPLGKSGLNGPPGNRGIVGNPGVKGYFGPSGEPGDITIAGVGIKGPRGPPGTAGLKGPIGPSGKPSRDQGVPGRPGTTGSIGPFGNAGRAGEEGPWGPPGEPGQPASYCPSDCGVSQILAPSIHSLSKQRSATENPVNIQYRAETSNTPAYSSDKSN